MTRSVTSIPVQEKDPSGPEDSNTPGLALMTSYAPVSIGMLSLTPGSASAISIAASVSFTAGVPPPSSRHPATATRTSMSMAHQIRFLRIRCMILK